MRNKHIFLLISMGIIIVISVFIFLKLNPGITGDATSGVVSFSIVTPSETPSGEESGKGIGGCIYNTNFDWGCGNWSTCINGNQTRTCKKINNCGNFIGKPEEIRNCQTTATGEVSRNYAKQLFDIKLELDSAIIKNSNELSAVIRFESFGSVPTPVNLTYRILNSSGTEVYSEKGNVVVTTEQIVRKNFETLNLPDGKYTLILTTVYGDNVTDEFRQEFSVGEVESLKNENNWILFLAIGVGVIILIIIFIVIYKMKRKRKYGYKKRRKI